MLRGRLLLLGEVNPLSDDPDHALYDWPRGCSGHRLRTLVLAVRRATYRDPRIHRRNLCVGRFSVGEARVAGEATREAQRASRVYDAVVALGARPWRALGVGELPEFSYTYQPDDGCYYARLPHPSGLCRSWNQAGAFERARDVMRAVYPGIPWGELLIGGDDDDE